MSEQALTKIEPMPIESVDRHAGPLDMEPAAFRAGLDRRKENRKALMDWIRAALVENVDFGRIDTKRGKSKPSLFKPGAEKICGMLGIISTFPTLDEYEQVALKGIEIKSVVLRCALLDSRGVIVAEGVGARSLAQDYGDLNKALKMAEKSAHIDATLRMAGLSEVFTQDLEDMPPLANIEPERKANVPQRTSAPATQTATAKPKEPAQATDKTRAWFLGEMRKRFKDLDILQWACDDGPPYRLMPDQTLEEWPLDYVPTTRGLLDMAIKRCAKFLGVDVPPEKPPAAATQSDDGDLGPQKTTKAVRGSEPDEQAWFNAIVPVPYAGMKRDEYLKKPDLIGELYELRHDDEQARKRLFGFAMNFQPKGWKKRDGTQMPPSSADIKFRDDLDQFLEWFRENHPDEAERD